MNCLIKMKSYLLKVSALVFFIKVIVFNQQILPSQLVRRPVKLQAFIDTVNVLSIFMLSFMFINLCSILE